MNNLEVDEWTTPRAFGKSLKDELDLTFHDEWSLLTNTPDATKAYSHPDPDEESVLTFENLVLATTRSYVDSEGGSVYIDLPLAIISVCNDKKIGITFSELAAVAARNPAALRRDKDDTTATVVIGEASALRAFAPRNEILLWQLLGRELGLSGNGLVRAMKKLIDSGFGFDLVVKYSANGKVDIDTILRLIRSDIDPELAYHLNS